MKLGRLLLIAAAGRVYAENIAGDLEEEFTIICAARGRSAGNRWYTWQVLRSVIPLMRPCVPRALCGAAIPVLAADKLWRFVYSQVPLKEGSVRVTTPYMLSIICIAVGGFLMTWNWRKAE